MKKTEAETEIITTEYIDRLIEIAKRTAKAQENQCKEFGYLMGYINALEDLSMRRIRNKIFEVMKNDNN